MSIEMEPREFQQRLRILSPEEFEHFIAELWERLLPGTTTVTQASGDMGVDVIRHGRSEREVLQVKRYGANNPLGRPEVQQYYSLYDQESADRVTVVTSGPIANTAQKWASEHGVTLFDGDDLYNLIRDSGASDLLSKWFHEENIDLTYRRRQSRLRRFLGALLSVPATAIRLGRPLWAGGVALVSALLILAGLANLVLAPFVNQPVSDILVERFEGFLQWLIIISFIAFPASLRLHKERRRFALFVGVLVVPLVISSVFTPPQPVGDIGTILVLAALVVIVVYDFYDLFQSGWRTHIIDSIAPSARRIGYHISTTPQESLDVEPFAYASVAARK